MDGAIVFWQFFWPQAWALYATSGVPDLASRLLFTTLYIALVIIIMMIDGVNATFGIVQRARLVNVGAEL